MNRELVANQDDRPRWYAIYTKALEEARAEMNLRAWRVDTFAPRVCQLRKHPSTGQKMLMSRPLFSRYIFSRFKADEMLHKVWFARGVHSVVSCDGVPVPIDDEIIALIQSRVDPEGYIRMDEFKPGDNVVIKDGPLKNLAGVFQKEMKERDRVMILLSAVSYQGSVIIEKQLVKKAS